MTKIDVAKAALLGQLVDSGELSIVEANGLLDSLISASHAEGVAEGAERGLNMAQRWMDSERLQWREAISLPHDALLASVLAPPDKTKKEEQ